MYSMKIKEQTRKLAPGCSKLFEVVDEWQGEAGRGLNGFSNSEYPSNPRSNSAEHHVGP